MLTFIAGLVIGAVLAIIGVCYYIIKQWDK